MKNSIIAVGMAIGFLTISLTYLGVDTTKFECRFLLSMLFLGVALICSAIEDSSK